MLTWVPKITAGNGPKYLAIAEALASDIRTGPLKPGDRLPPQRALAKALGVDLTTITRAFNEARRMGLIDANSGRGSFVRGAANAPASPAQPQSAIIDLSMNMPPQPIEARLRERIQEGIAKILAQPQGLLLLNYQESVGALPDRAAAARWLSPRLGPVPIERIAVTSGAESALYAILRLLAQPGDMICSPSLTYPGLLAIAERLKLRLAPILQDDDGLVPEALEEACERDKPKAIYCIPTISNPTTATMPQARREAVADIARRYGVAIIEDDAYATLPRNAPSPIATLAPDITWYVTTLSKCASPALRTAYVATPGLGETMSLAGEIRALTLMAPPLMTALASSWILDGTLDAITSAIREESSARQTIARRILTGHAFQAHPDGHHIWLSLPARWRQSDFNLCARQSGLALVPSDAFAIGDAPDAIRVSLGAAPDQNTVERGLKLLATVLSQGPNTLSSIV
ncbi:MAG: PLP-dependent aminotransferase family protein [Proteobacteria bacterium]|nr:PLP-dependent aminotransferase family protein [Pseudomonadota bacterium]